MIARLRGFTLIELMIALAIFGLLIMLAGPQLAQFLASSQVRNGAEAIYNGVQKTQTTAVGGNAQTRFVLDTSRDSDNEGTGGWEILTTDPTDNSEPASNPATPCAERSGAPSLNPVQLFCQRDGARDVTFEAKPTGDLTQITFDGLGRMQCNADGTANLQWVKVTNARNASAQELHVCISNATAPCASSTPIAASQLKLCDPNAPSSNPQAACPDWCK